MTLAKDTFNTKTNMSQTTPNIASNVRLVGEVNDDSPLVICFHGSGDSCSSWEPLVDLLSTSYRVLLWDRQDPDSRPGIAISKLLEYLDSAQLSPNFVLIAHSYGGTFARLFLEQRPQQVAGMVLVETGQETAIDSQIEQRQYDNQILANKPLVVIRGNTLIGKWQEYNKAAAAWGSVSNPSLQIQKQLLDATDKEDERLKKAQLQLSRNNKYVHIPDCGHGVIGARPDVVRDAVCWVMEHLHTPEDEKSGKEPQNTKTDNTETGAKRGFGARLKKAKSVLSMESISRRFGR
jgi:pimeloyl-ACP methyl ester carboxylesterase